MPTLRERQTDRGREREAVLCQKNEDNSNCNILRSNIKSNCSNDPYAPYLQDFFTIISLI